MLEFLRQFASGCLLFFKNVLIILKFWIGVQLPLKTKLYPTLRMDVTYSVLFMHTSISIMPFSLARILQQIENIAHDSSLPTIK